MTSIKGIMRGVLLTMVMCCSIVWFANAQAAKKAAMEGDKAYKEKNYEAAIKAYSEAISLEPTQYKHYSQKGKSELKLKKYDDAIKSFESATSKNPGYTKGYVYLSDLYAKKGDQEKAISFMRKAADEEKDQHKKLGYKLQSCKVLLKYGKADEASKELSDAKAIDPNDMRVLVADGDISGEGGKWQQALDSYQKALDKARQANMSSRELEKYEYKKALALYKLDKQSDYKEIADRLKASNSPYYKVLKKQISGGGTQTKSLRLASGYIGAADYDEALKHIKEAQKNNENPILSNKLEGKVYSKTGQMSQAITSFSKAAEAEKDPKKQNDIYKTLLKLQMNNRSYEGALQSVNKLLEKDANNSDLLFQKAQAQYLSNNYNGAAESCKKALSSISDSQKDASKKKAGYNFLLGLAEKKGGNKAAAKEAFQKASVGVYQTAAKAELQAIGAN